MKVPITMLLLTCLALASEGQRSQRTQARSSSRSTFKIKNVVREEDGARIQCLSCSSDFSSKSLDTTDSCFNPNAASLDKVKHTLITLCPPESLFCKVEISRIGGVFAGISRSCGGNYCVEACFQRGYGAEVETCTFCCGGILTNETNSYGDSQTSRVNKFNCP